jgi:hypothetical protein
LNTNADVGACTVVPIPSVPISSSRGSSIISSDQPNILVAGDSGPVPDEDPPTPEVDLALEGDPHSGSLEAEVEAPDA